MQTAVDNPTTPPPTTATLTLFIMDRSVSESGGELEVNRGQATVSNAERQPLLWLKVNTQLVALANILLSAQSKV